jgi:hypothetical protein
MTALIRGPCCTVGLLLLPARTAGTAQNQLPTVFTTCDTVRLADGICAFGSGNSVPILGSDGALVVDSGDVPSVTKRMIADITRLANQPVRSSTPTGIPTTSPAIPSIATSSRASPW